MNVLELNRRYNQFGGAVRRPGTSSNDPRARGGQLGDGTDCQYDDNSCECLPGPGYYDQYGDPCTPSGGNGGYTPVGTPYPPSTPQYFNGIVGLISQALSGWSHNQTSQINPIGGGLITNPNVAIAGSNANAALSAAQLAYLRQQQGLGAGPNGGVAEDFFGSISRIVQQHPLPVFGTIAVLFLLFLKPPGSKR